jgi:hypothetical protein
LVGLAAWYSWLIRLPLGYSKKEREIVLIYGKLERFYVPLQNALFSIGAAKDQMERDYIIAKAIALDSIVKKVNLHNLSSTELRSLIQRFSTKFHNSTYPADLPMDAGIAYDEMKYLLDKIEALISRDIKEFHLKLDKLTLERKNFALCSG